MRFIVFVSLLMGLPAFACEQFRWSPLGHGPEDDVQFGAVTVASGFEGAACFDSSATEMRDELVLALWNVLDSDYILKVDDSVGTVFERLVPTGTRKEMVSVPVHNTGVGSYRVTMTLTHPTEAAILAVQVSDPPEYGMQIMDVTAYKLADAGRLGPLQERVLYEDMPLERPSDPMLEVR